MNILRIHFKSFSTRGIDPVVVDGVSFVVLDETLISGAHAMARNAARRSACAAPFALGSPQADRRNRRVEVR